MLRLILIKLVLISTKQKEKIKMLDEIVTNLAKETLDRKVTDRILYIIRKVDKMPLTKEQIDNIIFDENKDKKAFDEAVDLFLSIDDEAAEAVAKLIIYYLTVREYYHLII